MYRPQNLRIPGPTVVPQAVLAASARPMINHRGPEFAALLAALTRALQDFLRTQGDVLTLTASGSGAMEAAIANTLSRGDKVLVFINGAFGERFYAICKAYGVEARRIDVTLGRAVEPDLVRDELAKEKGKDGAKAILIQHNETSTGVLNPIKEISEVVRESGKLFIVDSVSGAGAAELEIDEWGIDVCMTASQKAWGAPPGVSIVTMSERGRAGQARRSARPRGSPRLRDVAGHPELLQCPRARAARFQSAGRAGSGDRRGAPRVCGERPAADAFGRSRRRSSGHRWEPSLARLARTTSRGAACPSFTWPILSRRTASCCSANAARSERRPACRRPISHRGWRTSTR